MPSRKKLVKSASLIAEFTAYTVFQREYKTTEELKKQCNQLQHQCNQLQHQCTELSIKNVELFKEMNRIPYQLARWASVKLATIPMIYALFRKLLLNFILFRKKMVTILYCIRRKTLSAARWLNK